MGGSGTIGLRLDEILRRIGEACRRSGRRRGEVTLVGVSKGQPLEKLVAAYQAGLRVFGENRVQEAEEKAPRLPDDVQWHLIGPLQSNKVKKAVGLFQVVHTVDRPKIAHRLNQEAAAIGRRLPCFLEINLGREESKHGFDAMDLPQALGSLISLTHLEVMGLMAIPPYREDPESSRSWFRQLRGLRDRLLTIDGFEGCPGWLSMGMSHDFEVAVEEGATHVRVGTALFGPRTTAKP
ncbi:MAG: YggS family pyridoxal phosphate-dependent enzyme [Acidobacteria bacterium]|nr:YggS family pyridoxal phosphate-dependent enzyme [Acidobacteriota bacterium]